jgi:hypothetical protein
MKNTATKLRLELDLKLFKNGRVVNSTKRYKKAALVAWIERVVAAEWDSGVLRVWYSRANDYWNESEFKKKSELQPLLAHLTEWDLVKDFAE